MRRRLLTITKYKQFLPKAILLKNENNSHLYKLPEQNLKEFEILIEEIRLENNEMYSVLIKELVENNLLVSIDEFEALGIPLEQDDGYGFERREVKFMKKRSKKKREEEEELPKIFIIDGYETIKTEINNRRNGFEESLVRNGELQPSEMDIKDIEFHHDQQKQILIRQNNLLKV